MIINVNKVEHVLCCQSFNALFTLLRFQKNAFSLSRVCFSGFSRETTASILALTVCPVQTDENTVGQQLDPNIVECYMLGPFARPCCTLLSVVGSCCPAKFETVQTFSYVKTDATTPNDIVGRCYVRLQVVLYFYPKVIDNSKANLIPKTIFFFGDHRKPLAILL